MKLGIGECAGNLANLSLPTRGAWIEIYYANDEDRCNTDGRSPHGERGLKYERDARGGTRYIVAPHTGSVD